MSFLKPCLFALGVLLQLIKKYIIHTHNSVLNLFPWCSQKNNKTEQWKYFFFIFNLSEVNVIWLM